MHNNYNISTKIGSLVLTPTEKTHIYAEGTELVVRGKIQRLTFHFYQWNNDLWNLGEEGRRDYERWQSCYSSDATPAFKEKAIEIILPALNAWALTDEGKAALKLAEDQHQADALAKRREQIANHEHAIELLKAEIARLEAGEHLPIYSEVE